MRWCVNRLWPTVQCKPAAVYADHGGISVCEAGLMLEVRARSRGGRHIGKALFLFGPVVALTETSGCLRRFQEVSSCMSSMLMG